MSRQLRREYPGHSDIMMTSECIRDQAGATSGKISSGMTGTGSLSRARSGRSASKPSGKYMFSACCAIVDRGAGGDYGANRQESGEENAKRIVDEGLSRLRLGRLDGLQNLTRVFCRWLGATAAAFGRSCRGRSCRLTPSPASGSVRPW